MVARLQCLFNILVGAHGLSMRYVHINMTRIYIKYIINGVECNSTIVESQPGVVSSIIKPHEPNMEWTFDCIGCAACMLVRELH
jgi:hypothetical protein